MTTRWGETWRSLPVATRMIWPIFLLLSGLLLLSRGLIVRSYFRDIYILFDGQWRATLGQRPHIDFPSVIGQAYYWPFRLFGGLGDHDATTIIRVSVMVAAVAMLAMTATLARRLSPRLLLVAAVAVCVMMIAPRDVDRLINNYSFLAPYNRWCWGYWMIIALTALLPPARERPWLDGATIGTLLFLLAFTKLSFLIGALIVLVPAMLLGRCTGKTVAVALAVLVMEGLILAAVTGSVMAYAADLQQAIVVAESIGRKALRVPKLLWALLPAFCYLSVIAGIFWLSLRRADDRRGWWRREWRWVASAVGVIAAGILITVQNHPEYEYAHGVVAVLIVLQWVERRKRRDTDDRAPSLPCRPLMLAASAGLAMTAIDAISIPLHAAETWAGPVCPIPPLAGTQAAGLLVSARKLGDVHHRVQQSCAGMAIPSMWAPPATSYKRLEVQRLYQSARLIRANARPGDVVFEADFSNPFPFVLAGQPPRGALTWWDPHRNYRPGVYPDPEPILRSTTLVLQLKMPWIDWTRDARLVWRMVGPIVERDFVPVAESSLWRLWRRRGTGEVRRPA